MRTLLKGGRVLLNLDSEPVFSDVLFDESGILAVGTDMPARADRVLDVGGDVVLPGLTDAHVHFREPGQSHKETIRTGLAAAAAGGFSQVVAMANTSPPIDQPEAVHYVLRRAKEAHLGRMYPVATVTMGMKGEHLTSFHALLQAGAVAFSDDGEWIEDAQMMRFALSYAKTFGALIISHCECKKLKGEGVIDEGDASFDLGLKGIPAVSEWVAVARDVWLCEAEQSRLHVAHVSTQRAVDLVREARSRGADVSAEVSPHHVLLHTGCVRSYDTHFKMAPPLRSEKEMKTLAESLVRGGIDFVATDHAPHAAFEKDAPMTDAPFGIIGLESAVPLMYHHFVRTGRLSLGQFVQLLGEKPALRFGLPFNRWRPGDVADITVLSTGEFTFDSTCIKSKSQNTPFIGWRLSGRPRHTFAGGRATLLDGVVSEETT